MAGHDTKELTTRSALPRHVAIAFLTLSWFFLFLRVWTRSYIIANFGWDDSVLILATMTFTAYCAGSLVLVASGGGTHVTNFAEIVVLNKWAISMEATYIITVMLLKISLGVFFARIVVKRWQLRIIYVTVGVNMVSSTASLFYVFFRCGTDLSQYVFRQAMRLCAPRVLDRFFAYQQASFTTLTDIIFATLPIFILWNVNLSVRSKVSVGLILSLALLGCICSIIRFQYVEGITQIDDFFWNAYNIAIWSTIEPGAGIVAACLATLRPLFKGVGFEAKTVGSSTTRYTRDTTRSTRSIQQSRINRNTGQNRVKDTTRSLELTPDVLGKDKRIKERRYRSLELDERSIWADTNTLPLSYHYGQALGESQNVSECLLLQPPKSYARSDGVTSYDTNASANFPGCIRTFRHQ